MCLQTVHAQIPVLSVVLPFFKAQSNQQPATKFIEEPKDAKSLKVTRDLTLHGETKEIIISLTNTGEGKGPYGDERIGFSGRFLVKRSEFGMNTIVPQIDDDVNILLSFEGIKH